MIGGSIPSRSYELFSPLPRPDQLWGPPSLLSNGHWGWSDLGVKLTTHLHLVPRSRMRGAIHPVPQYTFMAWYSVKKSTGTTLPLTILRLALYLSFRNGVCWNGGKAPPTLNLGTKSLWKEPCYPLDRMPHGPQSHYVYGGEEKFLTPYMETSP
jgi:hypothetical protein